MFDNSLYPVDEAGGNVTVTIVKEGTSNKPIPITFSTQDVDAIGMYICMYVCMYCMYICLATKTCVYFCWNLLSNRPQSDAAIVILAAPME